MDSERKSKEDEENAAKRAKFEQTQENLRIKREEEARIAKEQGAARESFENDDYILNLGVTSFAHDEEADTWVCTLEDGDASCAVPDEMRDDLAKAVAEAEAAEPADGEEKALVKVTVNKSKKAVTAIA